MDFQTKVENDFVATRSNPGKQEKEKAVETKKENGKQQEKAQKNN